MASNDIPCLIDWNSPVIEYSCKPLIPLPDFNGQVQINGDNPFDAVEMQTNENEPFDLVLNKSLNSSSEEAAFDKIVKMKNKERNTPEDLIEVFDKVSLIVDNSNGSCTPPKEHHNSADISAIDLSPIERDTSEIREIRKRLTSFIERISSDVNNSIPVIKSSSENTFYQGKSASGMSNLMSSIINKGFVGNGTTFMKDFDSLMLNAGSLDEDLSDILPAWDELGLISSSSDEEGDTSLTKSRSLEVINDDKVKKSKDKVTPKTNVRLPLTVKDPNIRGKKTAKAVKDEGPLKAVIPIENMTKNANASRKLGDGYSNISNRFSKKLKADSTSVKLKRRSAPIATSTPTITRDPKALNKSKIGQKTRPSPPNRSCPPSPDSTSSRYNSRLVNSSLPKACSRKLALNLVTSSTSITYSSNIRKTSRDMKSTSLSTPMKSMATGVKSYVKNKENIVPYRY